MRYIGPGRVRRKLAAMIAKSLSEGGMVVAVNPEKLIPNQGYWRTDLRADVMPWIGYIDLKVGEKWTRLAVGSWATMTDCLRGFDWERHGGEITLTALHEKPAPRSGRIAAPDLNGG
jgi:hypothetical protein